MLKKVCLLFLFQCLSDAFVFSQPAAPSFPPVARESQEQWVGRMLDTLTLDQKIGQLFWVSYSGTDDQQDIEYLVRKYHLGGIIFQNFPVVHLAKTTHRLQQQTSVPLLFGGGYFVSAYHRNPVVSSSCHFGSYPRYRLSVRRRKRSSPAVPGLGSSSKFFAHGRRRV